MSSRLSHFLRPLVFGVILLLVSLGGFVRGQDELPGNTEKAMEDDGKKYNTLLTRLLSGATAYDPNNKDHAEALDFGGRYVTYRYTWVSPKTEDFYSDLEKHITALRNTNKSPQQPEVAKAYVKAVSTHAREVLNMRRPPSNQARLNAARVLAKLADLGQGDLADTLLDVFTQEIARDGNKGGPRNDGVTYYALHGMRDLLSLPPIPEKPPIVSPERDKKIAEALVAFINKAPAFTKDTPKEERDGYRALRREAVRALAATRTGQPSKGLTLLRNMARDGLTPAPHIDESIEAAIGLARLRSEAAGKDYVPDYAAFQLAQYTDYFAKYYLQNRDASKGTELRPYRIYASRLMEAVEAMKAAEMKNEYVAKAIDECRKVLSPIEKGELVKTLDLEGWLSSHEPAKDRLFQNDANSTAKPANRDMKEEK
jgi:hypothetical protein